MSRLREMIKELCPDGVEYRCFEDCCEYVRGITYNKSNEARNDSEPVWRVLRANNITLSSNTLNFDDVKLIEKTVRVKEDQFLTKGDILICAGSGSKEHIGKVAYIDEDMEYTFGGFMAVIRCNSSIDSRYLFHIFTSKLFLSYLDTALNSSTINNLNFSVMKKFIFPVPPRPIQNEIVKMLDNFTELTAELTAELALRKKQYEWYCGSLIGGATFPKRKISDIATFRYGYTTSAATSGDARYIRITDITDDGKLNPLDAKYTCISTENKEYLLKRDDLVMARTGATYGKTLCYNMDTPAIYASFLIKIQVDETQMLPRFYWHFTRTPEYWGQANRLVTKGGQPQFNTGAIGRIVIPIPPLEVQQKIVSILDRFDALCHDLSQGLPAEIAARKKQYEYYRDKLLTFPRKDA